MQGSIGADNWQQLSQQLAGSKSKREREMWRRGEQEGLPLRRTVQLPVDRGRKIGCEPPNPHPSDFLHYFYCFQPGGSDFCPSFSWIFLLAGELLKYFASSRSSFPESVLSRHWPRLAVSGRVNCCSCGESEECAVAIGHSAMAVAIAVSASLQL